ncbi:MAG TPA: GNAT family N-acetyltransferase [Actinophytocola sp.]|uniref:GNAT family N-acetyltransferase n=1 Tax=Actinophytocola sp. TaxID=1872138 RepID=UPI002DBE4DBF|nr:GNAT family N-acetyltransferase [Actinophytocola sp.]HEU5474581.1 GNAT family N-acetyltransferase [Actinophytocola sp.]
MDETRTAPHTWLLRVELDDRPGALARVTTRLAARDCNVLGLSVLPVPGGVVDELVIRTPADLVPATLVDDIRAEGGRIVGLTPADVRSLVDGTATALRAVAAALVDPAGVPEAVRAVLAADSAGYESAGSEPDRTGGHRYTLDTGTGTTLVARRGWAPFTDVEVSRAGALAEILSAAAVQAAAPIAVITTDGAGVVLRPGTTDDADAVQNLHARCSAQSLFARYHAGVRTLPRRLLFRLLSPPRGTTLLALCGTQVIGLAQLLRTTTPDEAEISVLIEDEWQGRGLGTAMIRRLATLARAAGHRELVAWCLPGEHAFPRTAAGSGLPMSVRRESDLTRVALRVTG